MTARTALTPTMLVHDGAVAQPAGTSLAGLVAAGATVAAPPGPNDVVLQVTNSSGAAGNITVRAGGSGNTAAGTANPGVPFDSAGQGDLVTSVGAGATQLIGPFKSDRFTQPDGSMSIEVASGLTGTIAVLEWPRRGVTRDS